MLTAEEKLAFVRLVGEKKDSLLGKFTSSVGDDDKVTEWKWIVDECVRRHGFNPMPGSKDPNRAKDWRHVRDEL